MLELSDAFDCSCQLKSQVESARCQIIVMGFKGTGKTQFVQAMRGCLDYIEEYSCTIPLRFINTFDEPEIRDKITIIDTPGIRSVQELDDIYNRIPKVEINIIIWVSNAKISSACRYLEQTILNQLTNVVCVNTQIDRCDQQSMWFNISALINLTQYIEKEGSELDQQEAVSLMLSASTSQQYTIAYKSESDWDLLQEHLRNIIYKQLNNIFYGDEYQIRRSSQKASIMKQQQLQITELGTNAINSILDVYLDNFDKIQFQMFKPQKESFQDKCKEQIDYLIQLDDKFSKEARNLQSELNQVTQSMFYFNTLQEQLFLIFSEENDVELIQRNLIKEHIDDIFKVYYSQTEQSFKEMLKRLETFIIKKSRYTLTASLLSTGIIGARLFISTVVMSSAAIAASLLLALTTLISKLSQKDDPFIQNQWNLVYAQVLKDCIDNNKKAFIRSIKTIQKLIEVLPEFKQEYSLF